MSDKNNLTGEVKEKLLTQLLECSKKSRIKSIAENYGIKLSDKLTKQHMIEAAVPAIEAGFGMKLKHYTAEDLSIAIQCFTESELSEETADRIMDSLPFADGAVYISCKKNSFFASVPHELAGKLMTCCMTGVFGKGGNDLETCAKACAAIYGKFTPKMLADAAHAFSLDVTPEQAEEYLASSSSDAYTFSDGTATSSAAVLYEPLPEASGYDCYVPSRSEILSYASYSADTSDYYYRQTVNFLYNNSSVTYDKAGQLLNNIILWCADNSGFSVLFDIIEKSKIQLSTDKFNFFLGMIGELNSRIRKPCLKGHRADEIEGYRLPAIPGVMIANEKSAPVKAGQKIGRNDPCPCGSGKKYKKCCGKSN